MGGDHRFFPLFIDMNEKKVLVIGGGRVSQRRAAILADFGADVTVISPAVTEELAAQAGAGRICCIRRAYQDGDVGRYKPFLVIAATDAREVNHAVMREAKEHNTLAIISDKREECDAWFPALSENGQYVAGLVSKTGDHEGVKEVIGRIRRQMEHA